MSVSIKQLKKGDVMCVGGQIGVFVRRSGKQVVYRPFGCDSTRERLPNSTAYGLFPVVRVERDEQWVEVTK